MPYTMEQLIPIIKKNVANYLNDKIKSDKETNNNLHRNPFYAALPVFPANQSFIQELENEYNKILGVFNNNKEAYENLIDERSFELTPKDFKEIVFKECSYIKYAFEENNTAIKYPYNKISPDTLLEIMGNIKSFIGENVQKQETTPEEAIKELFKLTGPAYTYSVKDADGMENKHLLGTRFKSFLLYHTHPEYYPEMTTKNLLALYMLTAGLNRRPDPRNCDFVKLKVIGLNTIDINKDYPYEKFIIFASSIYDELKNELPKRGSSLATNNSVNKYILVEAFLYLVYEYNSTFLKEVTTIDFKNKKK